MAGPERFVFINYSRGDAAVVQRIVTIIEGAGGKIWSDQLLTGGQRWWDQINDAIRRCDVFVYVLSRQSLGSQACRYESEYALSLRRPVLPVVVDSISPQEVPRPIAEIQWVEFRAGDEASEEALLRGFGYLSETPPLPDPLPPTPPVPFVPTEPPGFDPEAFSATVRGIRDELGTLPITASGLAGGIQERHGEYGGGRLATVTMRPYLGETAPVDAWLARVEALYDRAAVERSKHQVIDGLLLLLGLAAIDVIVAEDLADVVPALEAEAEVRPRRVRGAPAEGDIGFSADLVGDRRPIRASDDLLGIEDDVRTLCRLLIAQSTVPPLAVGLFGDWGTGKSFFLQRMRTRIEEMAEEASQSAVGLGSCEHVVQVTFNAWHYLDADLWASLANRLYQGVAGSPVTAADFRRKMFEQLASTRAVRDQAVAERRQAEQDLAQAQGQLQRLRDGELTLGDAASAVGLVTRASPELATAQSTPIRDLTKDVRFGQGLLRKVVKETSRSAKILALVAVVLLAAGVALLGSVGWLAPLVAVVPAVVAAGAAWVKGFGETLRRIRTETEAAQQLVGAAEENLRRQVEVARTKQEQADATLAEIRDGGFVRRYLMERVQSSAYRDRLGLVSLVREDLETLVTMLDPATRPTVGPPIDRIVLYIDDLDRCPPARVVEVLEAIHLLLAFPVFVVIVAVDSRWLLTSLELYYRELLGPGETGVSYDDWHLTPANYLEKIFQIPVVLRPMSVDGYARLVHELAGIEPTARTDGRPIPDGSSGQTDGPATTAGGRTEPAEVGAGASTQPVVPPILVQSPVAGDVLALRFSDDGRLLVVATTRGVWWWERGRRQLVNELDAELSLAAVDAGGRTVAALGTDRTLHVLDLSSGSRSSTPVEGALDLVAVTVVGSDMVLALSAAGELVWLVGRDDAPRLAQNPPARSLSSTAEGALVLWSEGEDLMIWDVAGRDWTTVGSVGEYVLSSDGELLTWRDHVRRWRKDEWWPDEQPAATRPLHYRPADLPAVPDLRRGAARSSEGWWMLVEQSLWCWADDDPLPTELGTHAAADRLAANPRTPLVVMWGAGGFVVAERSGTRYAADGVVVDEAAVSPLGRLVATAGGGEVRLWQVAATGAPELPSQLELEAEEAEFLVSLAPLVQTPRVAKRLLNVYRLLRASAAGRVRLVDPSTGDYRAVLLLLALVVGRPELADTVLDALARTTEPTWDDFVRSLLPSTNGDRPPPVIGLDANSRAALRQALALSAAPTPSSIATFRDWAEDVRRFHVALR